MIEGEKFKVSVEGFSSVQRYMLLSNKNSDACQAVKESDMELKAIRCAFGVNLTVPDRIRE